MQKTLPSINYLNIIVDSLPTKLNIIWRSLVDMKKVINALKWLKNNNRHYSNIVINENLQNPVEDVTENIFFQEEKNDDNRIDDDKCSLLLHHDRDYIISNNYSVININDDVDKWSDIEKYSSKKINDEPFSSNHVDLDHFCYPHLFPHGSGNLLCNQY